MVLILSLVTVLKDIPGMYVKLTLMIVIQTHVFMIPHA